jgi:hypothetical protein
MDALAKRCNMVALSPGAWAIPANPPAGILRHTPCLIFQASVIIFAGQRRR